MKKGLQKQTTGISAQSTRHTRGTVTKQSTRMTNNGVSRGVPANQQNSFMLQTSQSSNSICHSINMNGTTGRNFQAQNGDQRRGSLNQVPNNNFMSQAKLNSPYKSTFERKDMRTPTQFGAQHRPSNATMDRSTAMHSGMPSPSTAMLKHTTSLHNQFGKSRSGATQGAYKVGAQKKTATKTSAYMNRYRATNKTSQFWGELTKMAEKAGKINAIDAKRNPCNYMGPATGLDTRSRTPQRDQVSHVRGQGGITKQMNGVSQREVGGSQFREHVMEGRSVAAILQPDSAPQRRCITPKANSFMKSSQVVGSSSQCFSKKDLVDPAEQLKPNANFRKASQASESRLWTHDNDFGLYANKQLTKHEMCKAKSRERYFQSSITTLPGPSMSLNCVKTREQESRAESESNNIQRKKGQTHDKVFASHINTLPGQHTSTQNTQDAQEAQESIRQSRKFNDPAFKQKQAFQSSFMMDADKGRTMEAQSGFNNNRKDVNENKYSRAPSNVSMEARHRLIYSSNFKLE